jgi:hypothetical protein
MWSQAPPQPPNSSIRIHTSTGYHESYAGKVRDFISSLAFSLGTTAPPGGQHWLLKGGDLTPIRKHTHAQRSTEIQLCGKQLEKQCQKRLRTTVKTLGVEDLYIASLGDSVSGEKFVPRTGPSFKTESSSQF